MIALLALIFAQVALGLVSSDEDGLYSGPLNGLVSFDTAEAALELHELLFNVLLALIALHVLAVLAYRLFLGKKLTSAMVTGRTKAEGAEPMRPAKWWVALLCLVAAIAFARWVIAGAPPFGG